MAYKPCPRCKKLIPQGLAYCPDCKLIAERERQERLREKQKRYNHSRNQRNQQYRAFYHSKAWKQMSRARLSFTDWRCEAHLDKGCTGLAVEVHHIKPIQTAEGWRLRLDWDNLEAVCTHCHNLRHPEKLHKSDPDVIDLRAVRK